MSTHPDLISSDRVRNAARFDLEGLSSPSEALEPPPVFAKDEPRAFEARQEGGDASVEREGFLTSAPGRIALATGGLFILGMGVLAFAGPGPHALVIIALVPLVAILASIFAVGLSVLEDTGATLFMLLTFPFLAGVGLAGLYAAASAGRLIAPVLVVVGGVAIALSLKLRCAHFLRGTRR